MCKVIGGNVGPNKQNCLASGGSSQTQVFRGRATLTSNRGCAYEHRWSQTA